MGLVKTFAYKEEFLDNIKRYKYGVNWPVVYIIRNNKEAYIGESSRVYNRSLEHLKNNDRVKLDTIDIVADADFNKSATLELESLLIEHMAADGKYLLQNSNGGLRKHNYYEKDKYIKKFDTIWSELKEKEIVVRGLFEIRNSNLFKYSPYKSLTSEQLEVVESIVNSIINNNKSNHLIQGEPGTGKTIVAIYLLKYLIEKEETRNLKVGLVVPMTSLRTTLKKVFRNVKNLKSSMVLGPSDVIGKDYDILIVDEAHRLNRRVNITNMKSFDDCNRKLGLDKNNDQLDWIRLSTKHMILCYDKNQSIKPSDVRPEKFEEIAFEKHRITSQMRGLAGEDYINYIENIINENQDEFRSFGEYELYIFDNLDEMHKKIIDKDQEYGLCRMIAGYAWEWKSQKNPDQYDIVIGESKLKWNSEPKDWINSQNAIKEVGCIHTTQGYDINYAGVILGNEIVYRDNKIQIVKEKYYDKNGKKTVTDENELKKYIINIYKTILTRGIRGTYIYICDEELRNYFKRYIKTFVSDIEGLEKNIIEKEIIKEKVY